MLIKLTSGLQTRNHLGVSPEDLSRMELDKAYNYLRAPGYLIESEKKGEVHTLQGLPLNVHKDFLALIVPHPDLAEHGIVWGNTVLAGDCVPTIYFKAHKSGTLELEWMYEVRLIK